MAREEDEGKESNEKESAENRQDMTKKVYGDYEILKAIGKGKFAVVYRAKRKSDDEIVALKRISVDTVDNKTREKCLKEVKLLQSLDHPNIIRYMDSFINENDLVIVFEWAAAGDLKRQLRKAQEKQTPFEERIIWKYFSQIADAIQHMHERRIMHRDLKPANIFLTLDGTVKLGDLGLSRELSENTIQAHSKVGTPLYMSPEVLRGDGYDFKSDIWSIGCLLYELAMLKSPFKSEGLNLYSLFQKISKGEYSPLPERYSEELRSLAYSMISTNAEDRPEIDYICEIASRMRTKCADEYVKMRRLSKQREKDAAAMKEQEDRSEAAEDKSVSSAASSHTARRQKSTTIRRDTSNEADEQNGKEKSAYDKKVEMKCDNNEEPSMDFRDNGSAGRRQLLHNEHEDMHESSYPPIHRMDSGHKNHHEDIKYDNDNSGSTVNANTNKKQGKMEANGGNRFNVQPLGHSRDNDNSEWENPQMTDKNSPKDFVKSKPLSLPKNNSNDHREESSGIFSQNQRLPKSDHNIGKNGSTSNYSSSVSSSHPQNNNYGSRNLENAYAIPLADQHDYKSNHKPVMEVQRRKKSASEINRGDSAGRRGSSTKKRFSGEYSSPKKVVGTQFGEDQLTTASPMHSNVLASTQPTGSAYIVSGIALAQMEILYGKLTLLEYPLYSKQSLQRGSGGESICCLSPYHFAGDLTMILGRHAQVFPHSQYHTFVQVAEWLIQKSKGLIEVGNIDFAANLTIDVYNDPPISISKQLLKMAQDIGISAESTSEITPSSLSCGHGDSACIFLNLIADVAIQKYCKKQAMIYPVETVEDNDTSLLMDPEDDEVVEEDENMLHTQVDFEQDGDALEGESRFHMSMIMGEIDSNKWVEETERVASKLAQGQAVNRKNNFTSWLSHVETFQKHANSILLCIGDSLSSEESEDNIPTLVHGVQRSVLEGISGIARAESLLNNKQEFSDASLAFAKIKQELNDLEEKSSLGGKSAIELSEKLAEVQEQVQDMATKLAEKTGEGDEGGGGVITNLKCAIKQMKEEYTEMQVTTAIVQQQIMSHRIQQAAASRRKNESKKRKKKGESSLLSL